MLKMARERAGIGQREAARKAGISSGFMCELERGLKCPSVPVATELHRVLHLTEDEAQILASATVAGRGRAHPYRVPPLSG